MKIAVYPGSFDPLTNGHLDIIERASSLFSKIYVAVMENPSKAQSLFSLEERLDFLKSALKNNSKLVVDHFDGLLVDYARKKKAHAIIRGLRAVSDFDYEFQMALTNRKLDKKIETVFFMTSDKYSYLSSKLVKEIAGFGGQVKDLVPKEVEKGLKQKFRR